MRKILISILIAGFHCIAFGQEYINTENFKFKFIKAKKAVGGNYYYTIKTPKDTEKVQVRFKMQSLSGKHENFDPNKFFLVSDSYKWRMRPIDVRHNYAAGWIYIGFQHLVDVQPTDKRLKEWLLYKPEVKNTFNDYKMDGYDDICYKINFGTKKQEKIVSPYLDHKALKSCKVDLYFSLPNDMEKLKVYYGDKLIVDTRL